MSDYLTPRIALLSALYAILLIPFALALDYGFGWFTDTILLSLINWFNHLSLFFKIALFIFGGYAILQILFRLFKAIGNVLSFFIFKKLPDNWFTLIFSTIIYIANSAWGIYLLWGITPKFSFWIVLEFILLSSFVLSINTILIPWYLKAKIEKEERERRRLEYLET